MITHEMVFEKLAKDPQWALKLNADYTQGQYDRSKDKLRDAVSFGRSVSPQLSMSVAGSLPKPERKQQTSTPVVKPVSNASYAIGRGMNLYSNFSQAGTHIPEEVKARIALGRKLKELENWKP